MTDASSGALVPLSPVLLTAAELQGKPVTSELNLCQVETATGICTTGEEVESQLTALRSDLNTAAESVGLAALSVGSHPFSSWQDQKVNRSIERYRIMEDKFQRIAHEQIICGCHVHIGFADKDLRIATMTRARPWLPVLVALTANSPFWEGSDTGYDSYRTQVWRRWPTSGMPPAMSYMSDYTALVSRLEAIEAIEDPTHLYWYVRPSARFETLEFRASDTCLTPRDTTALAILVRAIAATCAEEVLSGAPPDRWERDTLEASMWRATRYGLAGKLANPLSGVLQPASEVVEALFRHIDDALAEHGDTALARDLVNGILSTGNGASRQRASIGSVAFCGGMKSSVA